MQKIFLKMVELFFRWINFFLKKLRLILKKAQTLKRFSSKKNTSLSTKLNNPENAENNYTSSGSIYESEQYKKVYFELIRKILAVETVAQSLEILNRHSDLINEELFKIVEQISSDWISEGEGDKAVFLRGVVRLASLNKDGLLTALSENERDREEDFELISILLKCNSYEELVEVYQANQDRIDFSFILTLEFMAIQAACSEEKDIAIFIQYLARVLTNLLQEKSLVSPSEEELELVWSILKTTHDSQGDRKVVHSLLRENLEKLNDEFIQILKRVTTFLIQKGKDEYVQTVAIDLCLFSNIISEFQLGNRAINLEIAIVGYEIALTVFNRENTPEIWAEIQQNLATVYSDRIRGDHSQNLEKAITYYENALLALSRESFPANWAGIHNGLGKVYSNRDQGNYAQNLEKALEHYQIALQVFTRQDFPKHWAMVQVNLGVLYTNRVYGNASENKEASIKHHKNALQVYTFETYPEEWAMTQSNLANTYNQRILGDIIDNQELAIACYKNALRVRTREASPYRWAWTHTNLASTYAIRVKGKHEENLQAAINACHSALQVFTLATYPKDWAKAKANLGYAYSQYLGEKQFEDLEVAINAYQSALQVFTREAFPRDWAETQIHLGGIYWKCSLGQGSDNIDAAINAFCSALQVFTRETSPKNWAEAKLGLCKAYRESIKGDKAENIEMSIAAGNDALQVLTQEAFPSRWAEVQADLGGAYLDRKWSSTDESIEQAIACYQNALKIYSRKTSPNEWAAVHDYLGIAYRRRTTGNQADNIEKAITHSKQALLVYTQDKTPHDWALNQMLLGNTYRTRKKGKSDKNQKQAIDCYQNALKVYTAESSPLLWALCTDNLANVYTEYIDGDSAKNLEQAINYRQQALRVINQETYPLKHAEISRNLGLTYRKAGQLHKAFQTFAESIETVEFLRGEIDFGDEAKWRFDYSWSRLYILMIETCLELATTEPHYYASAIEYIERSKARNFIEQVANLNLLPKGNISDSIILELKRLRRAIASEQRNLRSHSQNLNTNHPILKETFTHLNQLRKELDQMILEKIAPLDPDFSATQKVKPITLEQIQYLLDDETVILEWYFTDNRFQVFIITCQEPGVTVWRSTPEDWQAFMDVPLPWLDAPSEWHTYEEIQPFFRQLAEVLHLDEVLKLLPTCCNQVILIPSQFLHLIPIHALPLSDGSYFLERFSRGVRYAPSCQLLQFTQNRQRPHFSKLFAIQNPTQDLNYTDIELFSIRQTFEPHDFVLVGEEARKEAVDNQKLQSAHCLHFACHAYFDFYTPLRSALILADASITNPSQINDTNQDDAIEATDTINLEHCLTLGEIFKLDLSQCRLVTLSACETGMSYDPVDEYNSLPSGFLFAGSASVVSSFWAVNDLSTSFLMSKFYQNLRQNLPVAMALNQAQLWLRDITKKELETWIIENQLPLRPTQRMILRRLFHQIPNNAQPFREPFWWAAFFAIGQ